MKIIKRMHLTDSEIESLLNGNWCFYTAAPSACFRCGQWLQILPMSSRGATMLGPISRIRVTKLTPIMAMYLDDDALKINYLPDVNELPPLGLSRDRIYRNLESF